MLVCLGLFTTLCNWYCEWTKKEMRSTDVNAACFARKKKSGGSCFPIPQSVRLSSVLECGTLVTLDCCYGVIFVYSWFKKESMPGKLSRLGCTWRSNSLQTNIPFLPQALVHA